MPPDPADAIDQLRRSLAAVDVLISNIGPEQSSLPTPCTEWDVGRVVEHLDGMNRVFAAMLAGEDPTSRSEAVPWETLPARFRDSSALLVDAFATPGALVRLFRSPLGSATGSERLMIRMYDLLAHGWDLAQATGQRAAVPDDAAEAALAFVRGQLADEARSGRFAPAQPVPAEAPAVERLAAFLGRTVSGRDYLPPRSRTPE
jgi:uncharacterized protein (TIGR03086 family)